MRSSSCAPAIVVPLAAPACYKLAASALDKADNRWHGIRRFGAYSGLVWHPYSRGSDTTRGRPDCVPAVGEPEATGW